MTRLLCLAGLFALLSLPAQALEPPAAVQTYLAELARVEAARTPVSLEPLLASADAVQGALMEIDGGQPGGEALIETYSAAEFAALQQQLRGLHLQRGLEIFVQPQPEFLFRLAQQHGREADIAFFRLYRAYWGQTLFPIYMQPRALVIGCVKYGDGLLTELYEDWARYARLHPDDYRPLVQQMLRDFEEVVSLGTCACGDRDSVIRELRGFIKRFPDNPAVPAASKRWRELKAREEKLPLSCG